MRKSKSRSTSQSGSEESQPRRVVRIPRKKGKIPTLSDLHSEAYAAGMTVKEYVDHLTQQNMQRSGRRNNAASYDMGPEPWRKDD